ncbi:helix-turn-helix domain-containing protein, partial [bacterium]|nr:helix-turn-helix domain-containing protein [bacterium]
MGLGAAEIWLGENRITPTTDVLFGLLLFLTEQHPRPIAQSAVLRLMWPDIEESNRRHALRQLVYRIRRLGCPVSTANGSVLLEVKDVTS